MRLTNTTDNPIELVVKGDAKGGVPQTEVIAAGETKNVSVDTENSWLKGNLAMGTLTTEGRGATPAASGKKE